MVRPFRNLYKRLHPVVRDMMDKMPGVKTDARQHWAEKGNVIGSPFEIIQIVWFGP